MQYFLEGKDKEGNPIEVDEKGNNTFDLKKKIAEEKNRLQSQLDELRKPIKEAVDEFYSIVKAYGLDTSSDLKRGIGTYFHDKKGWRLWRGWLIYFEMYKTRQSLIRFQWKYGKWE